MAESNPATTEVEVHSGNMDALNSTVTSFRYDGSKASITFAVTGPNGATIGLSIDNTEIPPHPALVEAMDLLGEDLAAMCEVEDTDSNPVIFTKFTSSERKGATGYKLIGKRELRGSRTPMSIVSPLKWNDHADAMQEMDPVTIDRLEALKTEIQVYLRDLLTPVVVHDLFEERREMKVVVTGTKVDQEDEEPVADGNIPF